MTTGSWLRGYNDRNLKFSAIFALLVSCVITLPGCADDSSANDSSQASQQPAPTPGLVATFDSSSCQIWDPVPALTGTQGSWNGSCDGGVASGSGTATFYYDGSQEQQPGLSITGNYVNGMPDGNISFSYVPANSYSTQNHEKTYGKLDIQNNAIDGPGDFTAAVLDNSGAVASSYEIAGPDFSGDFSSIVPPSDCTVKEKGTGTGDPNTFFVGHCTSTAPTSVSPAAGAMDSIIGAANGDSSSSASQPSSDISGISYQLADGTFYLFYPDGNVRLRETGNFATAGDGAEQYIAYDDSANAKPRAIAQSAIGDDLIYVQVYNGATQPATTRADAYLSDNGSNIYLEGSGIYRTNGGKVTSGKWVDGCFNGNYVEDGFSSCATAAQALAADEQADAQIQAADQQAQEAQQQWDDAHDAAVWQEANANSQQMLSSLPSIVSQGEQNIDNTMHNLQASENQTRQILAQRSEEGGAGTDAATSGDVLDASDSPDEPYSEWTDAQKQALASKLQAEAATCATRYPDPGAPAQRIYYEQAACAEGTFYLGVPTDYPGRDQLLQAFESNVSQAKALGSNSPVLGMIAQ